jgi:outer membrane immunogenic protein
MKKFALALVAATTFVGSAIAADLAPQPYAKAPAPVVVPPSWTGFYIFGGGGGGIFDADNHVINAAGSVLTVDQHMGGSGWLGTVGAGYDWQFNHRWVAGVFGDGQFGGIRGSINDNFASLSGTEMVRDSWAAGVRAGYLIAPNVLSYVNGGYSGSQWSGSTLASSTGGPAAATTPSFSRNGWFVGGGVENNLDIFGVSMPGLFMKTEYRAAYYENNDVNLAETSALTGLPLPRSVNVGNSLVQTITTSLVYRFNWNGPVVAKY